MKKTILNIGGATFLGVILIASQASLVAQTEERSTTTRTTTSDGSISEFGPETIVIKSVKSHRPVHYTYTKTTTYVDENGAPVSREFVKSGVPVTVYYDRQGDKMVATKVIVRKTRAVVPSPAVTEEKKTTTTTTEEK